MKNIERYELSVPSFPLEKLKDYAEEGYFDDEVLPHLINELKGENKEALLNGEVKPYDCFELQILIRDLGWKQVYIDSECGITDEPQKDTSEEKIKIEEAIDQLKGLRKDRKEWIEAGGDTETFEKDIKAIDVAIKAMSGLILHKKGE